MGRGSKDERRWREGRKGDEKGISMGHVHAPTPLTECKHILITRMKKEEEDQATYLYRWLEILLFLFFMYSSIII